MSVVDDRLAARIEQKQVEQMLYVESIADAMAVRVEESYRAAVASFMGQSPLAEKQQRASESLRSLSSELTAIGVDQFTRAVYWSHAETVRILAKEIPRKWFRVATPLVIAVGEEVFPITPDIDAETDEPVRPRRLTQEEWEQFLQDTILPAPSQAEVEAIIYRPVAGVEWRDRVSSLSSRVSDPDLVAGLLASGYSQGKTLDQLAKDIESTVSNHASSARRIARTEGMRVANESQRQQYEGLGDLMSGVQIWATLDQNTRPHHALRNGTVYWQDGRRKPNIADLPQLPDEPNCRCYDAPVLTTPSEFLNDPAIRAEFENASGQPIVDPQVYDEWFRSASVGKRKMVVGSAKYESMKRQLGGVREPEWTDFIDENGKMLPLKTLRAETLAGRAARKRKVDELIQTRKKLLADVSRYGFVVPDPVQPKRKKTRTTPKPPVLPKPAVIRLGRETTRPVQLTDRDEIFETPIMARDDYTARRTASAERLAQFRQAILGLPGAADAEDKRLFRELDALVQRGLGKSPEAAELDRQRSQLIGKPLREAHRLIAAATTDKAVVSVESKIRKDTDAKRKLSDAVAFLGNILSKEHSIKVEARRHKNWKQGRAYYHPGKKEIRIAEPNGTGVYVHELAHHLEHENPAVSALTKAFIKARSPEGARPKKLRDLTGHKYGHDEITLEDEFSSPYVGKIYRGSNSTEVLTMGVQFLYEDPIGFAERDADYFEFIIGVITGELL